MNTKKTGEFIAKLRKEHGYTQNTLGRKLNVTSKAVSKWECGISLPDVSILNEMAQLFNITVEEILNGERKVIKEKKHFFWKNSKTFYVLVEIILILLLVLVTMLPNLSGYKTYELYSKSNDFRLTGILSHKENNLVIFIDNVNIINDKYINKKVYEMSYQLYIDELLLYNSGNIDNYKADKFSEMFKLKDKLYEISIYYNLTMKKNLKDKFMKIGKEKYKLNLKVHFIDENQDIVTIDIPITMDEL